jgi:hypothetical protein
MSLYRRQVAGRIKQALIGGPALSSFPEKLNIL